MPRVVRIIDKDRGWKKFQREIKKLNGMKSKIGLFGEGSSASNNVATRGAVHELGLGNNPKRSFIRNTFDQFNNDLFKFISKMFVGLQTRKLSVDRFVGVISVWFINKIKETIKVQDFIPLKPETIRRKGSSIILIHTSQMINSLTYKVERR